MISLRIAFQRFLARVLPFPDVEVTLNRHDMPFNTRVLYYYIDLDFGIDIIRIHTVELNLFIPGDLVSEEEEIDVSSPGFGSYIVNLVDFVLYGLKWESTVQAVTRCIGFEEARDLDNWVMDEGGEYRILTDEPFPFFELVREERALSL